jgi:hypothetical protein
MSNEQNSEIAVTGAVPHAVLPSARMTQTSFDTHSSHRHPQGQVQRVALRHDPKAQTGGMAHLASTQTVPTAITETVFVLVEGRRNDGFDERVYQIQMWRLTVLRQPVESISTQPPRKET